MSTNGENDDHDDLGHGMLNADELALAVSVYDLRMM